jgi:uncharacterized membrane protein YraQ (UPF0718 family)
VSGLYEVATWLVYTVAAITMLAAVVAAILAGLTLRLAAEFLRELGDGREESDTQQAENHPKTPRE